MSHRFMPSGRHRRRLRATLALVVVGGLVAVAGLLADGSRATVSAGPDAALGPAQGSPVTIQFWNGDTADEGLAAVKAQIAAFQKLYPNIKVKHTGVPFSSLYGPKLRTAMAARKGPDVVSMYAGAFPYTSDYTKGLRPLFDLITPAQRKQLGFVQDALQADPNLYAIPQGAYAYVWIYNKRFFRQAGLSPNQPPTTLAQLYAACDRLKAANIVPISGGFRDGYLGGWFHYFGFASQLFSPAEKLAFAQHKIGWRYKDHLASLRILQTLATRGCFGENPETVTLEESQNNFEAGKAAMLYWPGVNGPELERQLGKGNVGLFVMPRLPNSAYPPKTMDAGANSGLAITNFRPEVCRASWQLLSFLVSPRGQEIRQRIARELPNNNRSKSQSNNALERQILVWLKNPANHAGPADYISAQESAVEVKLWAPLVSGDSTPEEFADAMQEAREKSPPRQKYPKVKRQACN